MSIGEVAERAGVRTSAIRYYESIGVLPEPARVAGQRRYGPDVLRVLAIVEAAQRAGLSLTEIRELLEASHAGTPVGDHLRALARRKLPEVDALLERTLVIKRWLQVAATCECLTLDDCRLLETV
jgi:MerR family redox-sensitive transcriptional activator SoxR